MGGLGWPRGARSTEGQGHVSEASTTRLTRQNGLTSSPRTPRAPRVSPRVPAHPRARTACRVPHLLARVPRGPPHIAPHIAHRTSHRHIALADAKMPSFSLGRELLDIPDILYLVTKKLENDQLNFLSTCKVLAPRRTHFLVLKLIHENNKNLMELVNLERAFSEKREETFYPISQEVFNRCCFDQQIILAEIESIINTYIYLN